MISKLTSTIPSNAEIAQKVNEIIDKINTLEQMAIMSSKVQTEIMKTLGDSNE